MLDERSGNASRRSVNGRCGVGGDGRPVERGVTPSIWAERRPVGRRCASHLPKLTRVRFAHRQDLKTVLERSHSRSVGHRGHTCDADSTSDWPMVRPHGILLGASARWAIGSYAAQAAARAATPHDSSRSKAVARLASGASAGNLEFMRRAEGKGEAHPNDYPRRLK